MCYLLGRMREDTLKNLVSVVDKLEEKNLQEKIVRCMSNLQGDAEPSIRTNATIFLGRIAPDLKEPIRFRVLPGAFVKAMKDGFVHCRVAGVKAASACIDLIDINQLCGKVLPQVCLLLLDPSQLVRELAIELMQSSMEPVNKQNLKLAKEHAAFARDRDSKLLSTVAASSGHSTTLSRSEFPPALVPVTALAPPGDATPSKGWTSWAVDGLSKTIEQAVLVDQGGSQSPSTQPTSHSAPPLPIPKGMNLAALNPVNSPRTGRSISAFAPDDESPPMQGGWGDSFEVDVDLEEDVSIQRKSTGGGGWDEDEDWMDELNDDNPVVDAVSTTVSSPQLSKLIPKPKAKLVKEKPAVASVSKMAKPVKSIGAKKLTVDREESDKWDDF